jgi:16S rRNA (guanine966-N2)-methyltransferase
MGRRTNKQQRGQTKRVDSDTSVRIIGGEWRGRKLPFAELEGLRPTPDRVRETLFNWLQSTTPGAICLDLFSGSGALGLEALSRGASQATLIDSSSQVCRILRENINHLKAQNAEVVERDAIDWLQHQPADLGQRFDLVFLDPPFRQDLVPLAAELLESRNLLAADALIYVETETELGLPLVPMQWSVHREKIAGQVGYRLYRHSE